MLFPSTKIISQTTNNFFSNAIPVLVEEIERNIVKFNYKTWFYLVLKIKGDYTKKKYIDDLTIFRLCEDVSLLCDVTCSQARDVPVYNATTNETKFLFKIEAPEYD